MTDIHNNFDKTVNGFLEPFNNEYMKAAVALFLILYAGIVAPKLPANILKFFDNFLVKIAVFFGIVWISKKDPTVAIIASIAVLVTLMIANNQFAIQIVTDKVKKETFCSCAMTYKTSCSPMMFNNYVQPNQSETHGWYNDEGVSAENDTYYENEYSDADKKNNVYQNTGGKTDTDPYYPDHDVQTTKMVQHVPTTTAPKITRLPVIDPEYPDHTHRMPTNKPMHVNGGKIVMEPHHPDHMTTSNKKEDPILNSYIEPKETHRSDDQHVVGYSAHDESESQHLV